MSTESDKGLLQFQWGAFCRFIVHDKNTNEMSLIGTLPQIKGNIAESPPEGVVNFAFPLWVYALFKVEPLSEATSLEVTAELSVGEIRVPSTITVELRPNQQFAHLNVNLQPENGIPVRVGKEIIRMAYLHEGHVLGEVLLPLTLEVSEQPDAKN